LGYKTIQVFLAYFVKYSVFGYLGYFATKNLSGSYIYSHAFSLLYLFYSLGLFVAKLSLEFLVFENIKTLMIFLGILYLESIAFILHGTVFPMIQFLHSFCIGLVAGLTYINVIYLTYKIKNVSAKVID